MIRVNLLPHREERRKRQQQQFFIMLGVVVAVGALIWGLVHSYLSDQIDNQLSRNRYLTEEIAKVDKQIAEIKTLQDQIDALLNRKRAVELLQSNRAQAVQLLDQLVRQLPDGVYLKGVKQVGQRVTISGVTQSQARVSTLMRNIDSSPVLEKPNLVEIKAVQQGPVRANEFTLVVGLRQQRAEEPQKKPAPKKVATMEGAK
jgi:type IV pilus assembly protein PilN